MTTLTFPSLSRSGPTTWAWRKISNTQTFASPFTQSAQTTALPGARWAFTATWDYLEAADAALMRAFLANLRGQAGRFYLGNLAHKVPRGTAGGTPLVNGAAQTGSSLVTDGWTAGATLLAGDFIGFNAGAELRMAVANATADGTGNMTITLDEPIRTSPADNSAIVTASPTCIMRLSADEFQIAYPHSRYASFTLEAVESFA